MRRISFGLLMALLLSGCAEMTAPEAESSKPAATPETPVAEAEISGENKPDTEADAEVTELSPEALAAPHIYMALQPDKGGPTSVVFAIDQSRDNTPGDDPAIRITPADGKCNPQQLRWHEFTAEQARRPAYGPDEAAQGITARDLPGYMASLVTSQMLDAGLIKDPEDSRPQNVCTQKLLQQMIIERSAAS